MAYAEHQFRHSSSLADGGEAGDHIESARRQLAMMPGRTRPNGPIGPLIPNPPPFPEPLEYLWDWFAQISIGLPINGMTPPTLSWDTLHAWVLLTGLGPLEPWEAQALVQLSMMRAGIQSEIRRNQSTATTPPPTPPSSRRRAG